jgi:hypothetical protein
LARQCYNAFSGALNPVFSPVSIEQEQDQP